MKNTTEQERFDNEEEFHDNWALSEDVANIDVMNINESITAPEMRHITKSLGDITNKKLLDLGCGLGEASVYFAIKGANVTATDISGKMLELTKDLGKRYNVDITTHKSTAEELLLGNKKKFDIIYAGNLFHHIQIDEVMPRLTAILKDDGRLVSWDPIAYNPIINVYRRMAMKVRTVDEHPLKVKDIRNFNNYFGKVELKYFWFSTLTIFIIMALVQFRNPNKVRYWKKVVEEGNKWAPIYKPLAALDRLLLTIFPPFKYLCWNVVVIASQQKANKSV
jgi:2-polyprenyl-3-methyl-5-hydroxy-6-metoxy-1,4-benzoquinol methylase